MRRRRYGAPPAEHARRSKAEILELRRLEKGLRSDLAHGDCVRAASRLRELSIVEGRFLVDRGDSGRGSQGISMPSADRSFMRFVRGCIRRGGGK